MKHNFYGFKIFFSWFKFITDQIDLCKQRDAPLHNNASIGVGTMSANNASSLKLDDNVTGGPTAAASVSTTVDSCHDVKLK